MARFLKIYLLSVILYSLLSTGVTFKVKVGELNGAETEMKDDVKICGEKLYKQALVTELFASRFVEAQIRKNIFDDFKQLTFHSKERAPRQDDYYDEDEDEEGNRPPPANLIPQVANLIKQIFGGAQSVNFTTYVETASKLLPKPLYNQVVGFAKFIEKRRGTTTSTERVVTSPTPPAPLIIVLPPKKDGSKGEEQSPIKLDKNTLEHIKAVSQSVASNNLTETLNDLKKMVSDKNGLASGVANTGSILIQRKPPPLPIRKPTKNQNDEDEYDYFEDKKRQLNIFDTVTNFIKIAQTQIQNHAQRTFSQTSYAGSVNPSVTSNRQSAQQNSQPNTNNASSNQTNSQGVSSPVPQNVASPSLSMPSGWMDLRQFASNFRVNFGEFVRIMPQIFRGAREGVQLIQSIQTLVESFGGAAEIADLIDI